MEGFTVLLVDNEPTTSDRIYHGLSDQGLAIRRAQSQAQTLSEIEKKDIDVVLLDLMIAGTDGIELLREIKTIDPLVEVILLANQANPSIAIQGIKLGAFDFLFKSVDIDDLFHKLQDAYQKKAIQEEKIDKIRHFMDEDK
jgi:DNA-binding NtrC family response regulator